jgi:ABC-type multidrug transport system ATPase subunit
MINIVDLTQHYGVRPVLRGINMRVERGELMAVMGPNGMGKSTLLKSVAGILSPQKGYVEVDGMRRRSSVEAENAIRRKLVYLPDQSWMPENLTAREFLVGVGRLYEVGDDRLMGHVERVLDLFNLHEKADTPIRSYSTGQQKKTALASALITDASIYVLDEPFAGGLDPAGQYALKRVLQRLAEREDVTVLMATPVPSIVEGLAHRVAIIREGELIALDTPDGLREQTECDGALEEVLERLISPKTLDSIEEYLEAH